MHNTEHFTFNEMIRSKTAEKNGIYNVPSGTALENLLYLMTYLEYIRQLYGKPIFVNSGYRCQKLNNIVGGAKNSQHLLGFAADITTHTKEGNKELFQLMKEDSQKGNQFHFDQLIDEKDYSWIHVSIKKSGNRGMILHK